MPGRCELESGERKKLKKYLMDERAAAPLEFHIPARREAIGSITRDTGPRRGQFSNNATSNVNGWGASVENVARSSGRHSGLSSSCFFRSSFSSWPKGGLAGSEENPRQLHKICDHGGDERGKYTYFRAKGRNKEQKKCEKKRDKCRSHRWVEKCGKIVGKWRGWVLYRRNLCSAAKQPAKFIAHPLSELQVARMGKKDMDMEEDVEVKTEKGASSWRHK